MRSRQTARKVATAVLLALLGCGGPAASARRLPRRALSGASEGTPTQQPRLRRPYARGVKTQAEDSPPPPPATAAAPSATNSSSATNSNSGSSPDNNGDQTKGAKSGGRPNLGGILAGAILGVGALCAAAACLLVRLCLRITGPPLPDRRPAGGPGAAVPDPVDLPIIIGQHVTHPDGTIAGAIESSSSSSASSAASYCSDCSEQQCCLESASERAG